MPLYITPQLQNQIYWLCNHVHDVEWSGTLFFTTEGEFGEEGFSCKGHNIFLQDIGTEVYTEYEFDESYVAFLMQHPDLMDMKKAHVHSHNKMGVFFSGTDNTEIHDNSEYHNYYLSLIVNNKNEMCAKIAFRVKKKRDISSLVEYRGTNGEWKTKNIQEQDEEELLYIYNCEVILPVIVDDVFKARFTTVKETWEKKLQQKKEATQQIQQFQKDFIGQGELFPQRKPVTSVQARVRGSNVDDRIYRFACELLEGRSTTKMLSKILEELNKELLDFETPPFSMANYCDHLQEEIYNTYQSCFPEDMRYNNMVDILSDVVELLEDYSRDYPDLITDISNTLDEVIDWNSEVEEYNIM